MQFTTYKSMFIALFTPSQTVKSVRPLKTNDVLLQKVCVCEVSHYTNEVRPT